jgi:hypothetical protein
MVKKLITIAVITALLFALEVASAMWFRSGCDPVEWACWYRWHFVADSLIILLLVPAGLYFLIYRK